MKKERENFSGRFGVIMAMAGSAIGLGNIWRFPYVAGENGGGAFVLIYLAASIFLSLPLMFSECIIGRRTQSNTYGAMKQLAPGTRWKWLGLLTLITPFIILSYYSVVGGWSVDYLFKSVTLQFSPDNMDNMSSIFGNFISAPWMPLLCHTIFLGLTALLIVAGVKKGIEKFSSVTMPILFVLIILIIIYSLSLNGSGEGIRYLLRPDFSKITGKSIISAMGQSFYSLSLGVGTMLIYASYVKKNENIMAMSVGTTFFDLVFALLAGFAIMPAVFAVGIEPGTGPGLVFETLPYIFAKIGLSMPWLSAAVGILFFFTILVAALTSSISLLEVGVAYLVEEIGWSRKRATLVMFIAAWTLGCLCSLSFGPLREVSLMGLSIFEFCDQLTSNFLMAFGGVLFTIFVGWKMSKAAVREEFTNGGTLKINTFCFNFVYFLIRYVAPVLIIVIFVTNLIWK